MFNWIKKLITKKSSVDSVDSESPVEKEFEFSVMETAHIGDKYVYKVKAKSKEEAFKLLVDDFFGENFHSDKIKSESFQVVYPYDAKFIVRGMPRWFGKRISGYVKESNQNYQHDLESYCQENNIKLKK